VKVRAQTVMAFSGGALGLWIGACVVASYLNVDQFGQRLQDSLTRSLGRRVELSQVHFSLYKGPRFSVDSVTIHEDPAIGIEPVAYVQDTGSLEVAPKLWPLLRGKFVIAAIHLDGAHINLSKSGAATDPGRWNFASFVNRSLMSTVPAIHIRNSRINFKFGDEKTVFYLTEPDLDITPP